MQSTESTLRSTRRNLYLVLLMVVLLGATLLSNVFRPDALLSRWPSRAPWLIPFAIVLFVVVSGTGRRRLDPNSPEVRVVLDDEWRRTNLDRATRITLITSLAAQVPQAFLFIQLPVFRAVMGMAVCTIVLAMTTFITLFLIFDRDRADE